MINQLAGHQFIFMTKLVKASIAQWIEQQPSKLWVVSSSLTGCTKLIVMTIKELYYFAINHSLLDKEVDEVIRVYSKEQSKIIQPIKALNLDKVEYTFDDLIALFSN